MEPLLAARGLRVARSPGRPGVASAGAAFALAPGEAVGVFGPSGAGKTTLAWALLGLVPPGATLAGELRWRGAALLGPEAPSSPRARELAWRRIRGAEIALIPQEPSLALNPVRRVGDQVAEVLRVHPEAREKIGICGPRAARAPAIRAAVRAIFQRLGLSGEDLQRAYPHQLSGGQRQRVTIAQALICRPQLVIADEPTTALDPATRLEVLHLLRRETIEAGRALLLISHDRRVLRRMTSRVLILETGGITASIPPSALFAPEAAPARPWGAAMAAEAASAAPAGES